MQRMATIGSYYHTATARGRFLRARQIFLSQQRCAICSSTHQLLNHSKRIQANDDNIKVLQPKDLIRVWNVRQFSSLLAVSDLSSSLITNRYNTTNNNLNLVRNLSSLPANNENYDRVATEVEDDQSTTPVKSSNTSIIIDVADLAESMRAEVRAYTSQLKNPVRMVGILASSHHHRSSNSNNDDETQQQQQRSDAEKYSQHIATKFAEDGLEYDVVRCPAYQPKDVVSTIQEMNDHRPDVHGILVFYPIFNPQNNKNSNETATTTTTTTTTTPSIGDPDIKKQQLYQNPVTGVRYKSYDDYLRDVVSPAKDVEGLCQDHSLAKLFFPTRGPLNRKMMEHYNLMQNTDVDELYIPCTVLAIEKILETYHPRRIVAGSETRRKWKGCTVTVVNRSSILGRPLAALLALEGADVYSVDDSSILFFRGSGDQFTETDHKQQHFRRLQKCSNMTLSDCLKLSSIVVTAVPSDDFVLPSEAIMPGTTVVDVSENSNVEEASLSQIPDVRLINQIGKVTVAALEQNLIRLHQKSVLHQKTDGKQ